MITPRRLYKKLVLDEGIDNHYTFELFQINEYNQYDFTDNLNFESEQDGVYIFVQEYYRGFDPTITRCVPRYRMLYCGKTTDLRTRFAHHHHKEELSSIRQLYLALCFCDNSREIDSLEQQLLNAYHFEFNDPHLNSGEINTEITRVDL